MNMTSGEKIKSLSKALKVNGAPPRKRRAVNVTPVMIYVDHDLHNRWEEYAHEWAKTKSQLAREALEARLNATSNDYTTGYNDALEHVAKAIGANEAFQMRFPSGRSFAELVDEELAKLHREQKDDGARPA
jgi:predicted DNA-binding protein